MHSEIRSNVQLTLKTYQLIISETSNRQSRQQPAIVRLSSLKALQMHKLVHIDEMAYGFVHIDPLTVMLMIHCTFHRYLHKLTNVHTHTCRHQPNVSGCYQLLRSHHGSVEICGSGLIGVPTGYSEVETSTQLQYVAQPCCICLHFSRHSAE